MVLAIPLPGGLWITKAATAAGEHHGALAVIDKRSYGYSIRVDFLTVSERSALSQCGRNCSVVLRLGVGECFAYAQTVTSDPQEFAHDSRSASASVNPYSVVRMTS